MVVLGARTAALILACFAITEAAPHNHEYSGADPNSQIAVDKVSCGDVIQKHFAVVGGGPSGTYSAIRLKEMGHDIVLIEAKDQLGGHSETYIDISTGGVVDIGVAIFANTTTATDYFGRFDIPVGPLDLTSLPTNISDFTTRQQITPASGFTTEQQAQALQAYALEILKYSYLQEGWNLPETVPDDLLMPFGEFVIKYKLQASVPIIWAFGQGTGDLLEIPPLYVMKLIDVSVLLSLQTGFIGPISGGIHQLYEKALAKLGSDVMLSSTVIAADRPSEAGEDECAKDFTTMVVDTGSCVHTIEAKRLIITIPPLVDNVGPFGLDDEETALFSQFQPGGYYTAVIRNSGLNDTANTNDVNLTSPYGLSPLPGIYGFNPTDIPGLLNVKCGSVSPISDVEVVTDIAASIFRLAAANGLESDPTLEIYSSHCPFELKVDAEAIRGGFYARMGKLQGYKGTFWTGAAWHAHDSSRLWVFTEGLLQGWVETLG